MRIFLLGLMTCLSPGLALAAEGLQAAKLVRFTNDVLFRRTGSVDWGKARPLMDLFERDTIYTMAASRAEVRFHTGETLALAPNTLVVLRPPGRKSAEAEMLAGELHSRHSRIITRGAVILPKTADAEFSARLKEDLTTVVSVTRGVAEVEARGGKVEVRKGYFTEVRPDMAPSQPVELAARLKAGTAAAVPVPVQAPSLRDAEPPEFSEYDFLPRKAPDSADAHQGYQLQVAKDRDFSFLVHDRTYNTTERPDLKNLLPPGDYFMRAAKIDLLGYKGKFSAPRLLKLKGDR
ncbi:MAG: hypothetical protein Q8O90_02035 [Elusimicrobiota bacterium]|nr:hypothetical protein [Elusimicrobiota bacterium]